MTQPSGPIKREAEEIVYPKNSPMEIYWKELCANSPGFGEELETIKFKIERSLQRREEWNQELVMLHLKIETELREEIQKLKEENKRLNSNLEFVQGSFSMQVKSLKYLLSKCSESFQKCANPEEHLNLLAELKNSKGEK